MKKYLYILIIMALVLMTFSVPAVNAANLNVTVSSAAVGETYRAFKLFDSTHDGSAYAYTYTSNTYGSASDTAATIDGAVKALENSGYITTHLIEGTSPKKYTVTPTASFTEANIASFLKARYQNSLFPDSIKTTSAVATGSTPSNGTASLTLPSEGYYFITTTQGTVVSAKSFTDSVLTIADKNVDPTITKTVRNSDVALNDTVTYDVTLTIPKGVKDLIFYDTFPAGVTYTANSLRIYTNSEKTVQLDSSNYTMNTASGHKGTFEVDFTEAYLNGITANTTLYIVSQGKVNTNINISAAVEGSLPASNINTATIEWGEHQTASDIAGVRTGRLILVKYGNSTSELLNNVEFKVYAGTDMTHPLYFVYNSTTKTYRQAESSSVSGATDTVKTGVWDGKNGRLVIDFVKMGDYHFMETKTNDGYQLKTEITPLSLTTSGSVATVEVYNQSGVELPSTGGVGSKIFITIGLLTMLATGVILAANRLMKKEDLFD